VKKERRGLGYDPGLIRTRTHKRNSTSHSDKVREKRTIALTKVGIKTKLPAAARV